MFTRPFVLSFFCFGMYATPAWACPSLAVEDTNNQTIYLGNHLNIAYVPGPTWPDLVVLHLTPVADDSNCQIKIIGFTPMVEYTGTTNPNIHVSIGTWSTNLQTMESLSTPSCDGGWTRGFATMNACNGGWMDDAYIPETDCNGGWMDDAYSLENECNGGWMDDALVLPSSTSTLKVMATPNGGLSGHSVRGAIGTLTYSVNGTAVTVLVDRTGPKFNVP